MSKIRITNKNTLTITQTEHGVNQSGKAIDIGPDQIINPVDGSKITKIIFDHEQSYFELTLPDGSVIQFVHGATNKKLNEQLMQWEIIGYPYFGKYQSQTNSGKKGLVFPSHWHVSIKVNGVWDNILSYIDRSVTLKLGPGFASQQWKNWSKWPDKQLNFNFTQQLKQPTMNDEKYKATKNYIVNEVLGKNLYRHLFSKPQEHIEKLKNQTLVEWFKVVLPILNRKLEESEAKYNKLYKQCGGLSTAGYEIETQNQSNDQN